MPVRKTLAYVQFSSSSDRLSRSAVFSSRLIQKGARLRADSPGRPWPMRKGTSRARGCLLRRASNSATPGTRQDHLPGTRGRSKVRVNRPVVSVERRQRLVESRARRAEPGSGSKVLSETACNVHDLQSIPQYRRRISPEPGAGDRGSNHHPLNFLVQPGRIEPRFLMPTSSAGSVSLPVPSQREA